MTQPNLKVVCDECKKEFEIEMQIEMVNGTVEKNFFVCPLCNKEYISFCIDQNIRKKQSDLKMLFHKLQTVTAAKKYDKIFASIQELEKDIKKDMQALKASIVTL